MANPQPTPFVQFSKELFDALLLSDMPATHKEIVLAVIRRTYGERGQKSAAISQTLLQQMIGRHRNGIRRSLRELQDEGVIVQASPASFETPAVLRLNKDYETWGKWSVKGDIRVYLVQDMGEVHPDVGGEVHPDVGGEVHPDVGGEVHPDVPIKYIETKRQEKTLQKCARQSKPSRESADGFQEFWKLYPHKADKGHAEKAWNAALKKTPAAEIVSGLVRLLPTKTFQDPQFIPYPATWLNGERWHDEPPPTRNVLDEVDRYWGGLNDDN